MARQHIWKGGPWLELLSLFHFLFSSFPAWVRGPSLSCICSLFWDRVRLSCLGWPWTRSCFSLLNSWDYRWTLILKMCVVEHLPSMLKRSGFSPQHSRTENREGWWIWKQHKILSETGSKTWKVNSKSGWLHSLFSRPCYKRHHKLIELLSWHLRISTRFLGLGWLHGPWRGKELPTGAFRTANWCTIERRSSWNTWW